MAEETMKAGRYELLADHYKQITSKPGQPVEFTHHTKGDVVELTAEDAERLKDVICKPGDRQRQEADRLRAEAERLQANADRIAGQAKDAEGDARQVAKDGKAS